MNYCEVVFNIAAGEEYHKDLLIGGLGEIGYGTFEEFDNGFKAYIPSPDFNQAELDTLVSSFLSAEFRLSYELHDIAHRNWNELWESNFEPLLIGDSCYVRATFHPPHPEYRYEIVIDPKMAFGTGHHDTTSLMISYMLDEGFSGKSVLDMGCGTGILAILGAKAGAKEIVAIDYDPVCFESTIENSGLNDVPIIQAICGSAESIPDREFDIILANINRNILLEQLDRYSEVLKPGGVLYLSGFYEEPDLQMLTEKAQSISLVYADHKKSGDWVAAKFIRSSE